MRLISELLALVQGYGLLIQLRIHNSGKGVKTPSPNSSPRCSLLQLLFEIFWGPLLNCKKGHCFLGIGCNHCGQQLEDGGVVSGPGCPWMGCQQLVSKDKTVMGAPFPHFLHLLLSHPRDKKGKNESLPNLVPCLGGHP